VRIGRGAGVVVSGQFRGLSLTESKFRAGKACAMITRAAVLAAAFCLIAHGAGARPLMPEIGMTERIAGDPAAGFAIDGYDPVAYISEGRPTTGRECCEIVWQGAAWRFISEANMALFRDNPERYAPQLGGYDPVAVMAGRAVEGNPQIYRLRDGNLYLFVSEESRAAFTTAYDYHEMQNAWQRMRESLAP
jgi:YHS domain-containing protein